MFTGTPSPLYEYTHEFSFKSGNSYTISPLNVQTWCSAKMLRRQWIFGLSGRETNNLLVAAGFLPQHTTSGSENDQRLLRKSLVFTLQAMDPTPASIIDPCGDVIMVKASLGMRFARLVDDLLDAHAAKSHHPA